MKERKIMKSITIYESVFDEVKKRLGSNTLSGLIENLLVSWCQRNDRLKEIEDKIDKMSDKDIIKLMKKERSDER